MANDNVVWNARFEHDEAGWTGHGKAQWSSVGRLGSNHGSLAIYRSSEEDDAVPAGWRSPVIKGTGKPLILSFWAADNYLVQPDYTYAALVTAREVSDATDDMGPVLNEQYIEWDNTLPGPFLWGQRLSHALHWRYYELPIQPGDRSFQIQIDWPKPMVRGVGYFADFLITEQEGALQEKSAELLEGSGLKLEVSTPSTANLIPQMEDLRFDCFFFTEDGSPILISGEAELRYEIIDYHGTILLGGMLSFDGQLKTVEDKRFMSSEAARKRLVTEDSHRLFRFVVPYSETFEAGAYYKVRVVLQGDSGALAEDTIPFSVVETDTPPGDGRKSRFYTRDIGFRHYDAGSTLGGSPAEQDMIIKMRSHRTCLFEYDWSKAQPEVPGPITVISHNNNERAFLTYMPNIEQVPSVRFVPEGARGAVVGTNHRGHTLVDYDVDAYIDYILAYIEESQGSVDLVFPSGLERPLTPRAAELQRKAYARIKERFPDVRVGCTIYGDTEVKAFINHNLHEVADALNFHIYSSQIDLKAQQELTRYYRTLGKPVPPFISTEFAKVSNETQLGQSAAMMAGIFELFAHEFEAVYYYNQMNHQPVPEPDLDNQVSGSGAAGYRFIQLVDRPVMAPEVKMAPGQENNRWTSAGFWGAGVSLMPTLATTTYYHLVEEFDFVNPVKKEISGGNTIYQFHGPEGTRSGIIPAEDFSVAPLIVRSSSPYWVRDLFGSRTRVVPVQGVSILQLSQYPVTLMFDEVLEDLSFEVAEEGIGRVSGLKGGSTRWDFRLSQTPSALSLDRISWTLRGSKGMRHDATVDGEGDGVWVSRESVPTPAGLTEGIHYVEANLYSGEECVGVLYGNLDVTSVQSLTVRSRIFGEQGSHPGVDVTVRNSGDTEVSGTLSIDNDRIGDAFRPGYRTFPVVVPAQSERTFSLPIDERWLNANSSGQVKATVEWEEGNEISGSAELMVRSCAYHPGPLTIDGDLSDWPLNQLSGIEMERIKGVLPPGQMLPEETRSPAKVYTMWDDHYLYMAAVVHDTTPLNRSNNTGIWRDDNLLMGFYPFGHLVRPGMPAGYYREHIGLLQNGDSAVFRLESPGVGTNSVEGIKVAVRRTDEGYVYEIAYPHESLVPLNFEKGEGFRLSISNFDARPDGEGGTFFGEISFFGGANINWAADPRKWYAFELTR